MNVVVFGATGIAGKAIVNEALLQGHDVTVLTRDAKKITTSHERLHVAVGDVTDPRTVSSVLKGQDAVIQTLGIGGKGDGKPTTFVSEANNLIMSEMEAMGIRRFIAISVIGAGNSLSFLPWIYRKMVLPLFMRWFQAIIDDKNRMEAAISQTNLDWTIVRCTTINTSRAKGQVKASLDGKGLKFSISAADMAAFFVEQLSSDKYLRQSPTISN